MTGSIRVGVVGVGYLGSIHARIYSRLADVQLVGVVDINADTARSVAREVGSKAYSDPRDLLGQVDAISIVVPTCYHLETARPFLENGVHMLMEKPIAPTVQESRQLVELAEQAGVVFQVGFLERFNAGLMALAEKVEDPRFIEVHRLSTFVERATDVDVITDLMIHDIDIVLSLINSNIVNVSASGISVLTNHVDIANARLEFANGAVANVTASRVSNKKHRRIQVFEHQHFYGLNFVDQQLEIAYPVKRADRELPDIVMERPYIKPRKPLDTELAEFINSIRSGKPPLVNGWVGIAAIEVAHRVREKIAACK